MESAEKDPLATKNAKFTAKKESVGFLFVSFAFFVADSFWSWGDLEQG